MQCLIERDDTKSDQAPEIIGTIMNATTRRSCRQRTNKKRFLPARNCSATNSSGRWCACSPFDNGQALTPLPLVETHSATGVAASESAAGVCEKRGLEEVGIAASTHDLVESAQISPNALEVKVGISSAYTGARRPRTSLLIRARRPWTSILTRETGALRPRTSVLSRA